MSPSPRLSGLCVSAMLSRQNHSRPLASGSHINPQVPGSSPGRGANIQWVRRVPAARFGNILGNIFLELYRFSVLIKNMESEEWSTLVRRSAQTTALHRAGSSEQPSRSAVCALHLGAVRQASCADFAHRVGHNSERRARSKPPLRTPIQRLRTSAS